MKIRSLGPDEVSPELLERLVELEERAFGSLALNRGTLPPFVRYGKIYLLEDGEELRGHAILMRSWGKGKTAYLFSLEVEEGFRGEGKGSYLLNELMDRLKEEGVDALELTVHPANQAALSLYRGKGFSVVKLLKDLYGGGEDRLLLRLEL
jgi:ribosomal-protein-alanine N-acetyltransferase